MLGADRVGGVGRAGQGGAGQGGLGQGGWGVGSGEERGRRGGESEVGWGRSGSEWGGVVQSSERLAVMREEERRG